MRSAISPLTLLRPRSLNEALAMIHDEAAITPLAGCTDVYVNLQFGTLAETRFIDLWPFNELRVVRKERGRQPQA